ncbi:MAG TPA: LysR family transcriptional regulator [Polyangiaceae bacterium]|nr:LysR family transcriptional regulator [Polyangiaceae bacterium]
MLHPEEQSDPALEEVLAFIRVAETLSFTRAAARLGLPKSTVSRRVARLEAKLGATLLQRTTRRLSLTEAGTRYHERAGQALALLDAAGGELRAHLDEPRGHVRFTAPFETDFLWPLLESFLNEHPNVTLEAELTDRSLDLVGGGYDFALRATSELPDSTLVAQRISETEFILAASPAYLARAGEPQTPADLSSHSMLLMRAVAGRTTLRLNGASGPQQVSVHVSVTCNSFGLLSRAACSGAGILMAPVSALFDELCAGALVRVLPAWIGARGTIYFVHPGGRFLPAKVRALRDVLVKGLREQASRQAEVCQRGDA